MDRAQYCGATPRDTTCPFEAFVQTQNSHPKKWDVTSAFADHSPKKLTDESTGAKLRASDGTNNARSTGQPISETANTEQELRWFFAEQLDNRSASAQKLKLMDLPQKESKRPSLEKQEVYAQLYQQLVIHQNFSKSQSYLEKAFDIFCRADENSLADLEELQRTELTGDDKEFAQRADQAILHDRQGISTQHQVSRIGCATVKTATLCMKGESIWPVAGVFAADQMRPSDSPQEQALDGLLGSTQGVLTRWAAADITSAGLSPTMRSLGTGVVGRTLESGCNRRTFLDDQGHFNNNLGIQRMYAHALDPRSITKDTLVPGTSTGITSALNTATLGNLSRSPLANTLASGTLGGASSGVVEDLLEQADEGKGIDLSRTLERGTLQATMSGLARVPSGIQLMGERSYYDRSQLWQTLLNNRKPE